MSLTRDDILSVQDIEIEEVPVQEWGGSVYVIGMTGTERGEFESLISEVRGKNVKANLKVIRETLGAFSICDKDGTLLFTKKDIQALGKKSAAALERVAVVAMRLSGIGGDDIDELAQELEENPSDGSASD